MPKIVVVKMRRDGKTAFIPKRQVVYHMMKGWVIPSVNECPLLVKQQSGKLFIKSH